MTGRNEFENRKSKIENLTRREILGVAAAGAAVAALGGCAPVARRLANEDPPLPLPSGDALPTVRLLSRAGFGPRPGDVARVEQIGAQAYVQAQLKAAATEDISLQLQLQRLDVLQIDDPDLEDLPRENVIHQLQQAALLRAVHGRNQLLERMVDFWTNHFNVYARKGDSAFRKGADERDVIRANALGRFPELLRASSRSPAMLAYLDNPQNLESHPNENYARELMELHTLGLGGGYSQRDVQEVARCFTGWTIEDRFLRPRWKLRFVPERHDNGAKRVLGHVIPAGGGERDADMVLDILANHPSTAHFIAKKLVRHFYGAEHERLIGETAQRYQASAGDIPHLIAPLLDPALLADAPPVLKRPFDYIVSTVRATGGFTDGGGPIQGHLSAMGEPLYQWPMPDGYPIKTSSWTGSMLPRWNFAHAFAAGSISGTAPNDSRFESIFSRRPASSDEALLAVSKGKASQEALALYLASPSFQWW